MQAELIQTQGESLNVSLDRNRMNDENGPQYILSNDFDSVDTIWDVEIDNKSIQAPVTISKWTVYRKWNNKFSEVSSSALLDGSYTPFYTLSGEMLSLPFTIAAGNTLRLRMKVTLGIAHEAAGELYKFQTERMRLTNAEGLYSWNLQRKGTPKDIFGNEGYDQNGFHLAIPEDEKDKLLYPVLRLDLQSNRGKAYSAFASWYYMLVMFPRSKWDEGNREAAKHSDMDMPLPYEKK